MSRVFKVDYIPDPAKGRPLWNAKIFVGVANQDPTIPANQIQLTGDIGFPVGQSIPVPQPVRTNAGGITVYNNSPLDLNAPGQEYAIQIFDRNDNLIYNFPQVDGSVVMNTTSQEEVTGLTIWPEVGEAVIGQTIPAGTDAIRYPFNGRSTLFTIKPPVAVTGTITNITINSNGIGELEVDNSDVYDLAEFNSFIAANEGDSQLAGGNIWPLSSQDSASTTPPFNEVPPGSKYLRDSSGVNLYLFSPVVSGTITAIDFASGTATIGGNAVSLQPVTIDLFCVEDIQDVEIPFNTIVNISRYYRDGGIVSSLKYISRGQGWPVVADERINHSDSSGNFIELILDGEINPLQAGAVPDDGSKTNDSMDAFQASSDYIGMLGGGRVKVSSGNYFHNSNSITGVNQFGWLIRYDNIHIDFESKSSRIVKDGTIASATKAITVSASTASSPATKVSNILISGGGIDGGNEDPGTVTDESSHGIDTRNVLNVEVMGMDIRNCRGDSIYIAYGSSFVNVHHNTLFGSSNRQNTRQGVAVLSGFNISIHENNIGNHLIGVDLEIDDNQISNGYNYLRRIKVTKNDIYGMKSEGAGILTPLVSSSVVVNDILFEGNTYNDIDESLLLFDMTATSGPAVNVIVRGEQSNSGSNTFKGLEAKYVLNFEITSNVFDNCENEACNIGVGCENVRFNGGYYRSKTTNGLRLFDDVRTERTDVIIDNTIFESDVTTGGDINGPYDIQSNANFLGASGALVVRGSGTNGNSSRIKFKQIGGKIESSDTTTALVLGTFCRLVHVAHANIEAASGATTLVDIDASSQTERFIYNEYLIDNSPTPAAGVINGSPTTLVDF